MRTEELTVGQALVPLVVFDPSITKESPIGSCLLKMLQPLVGRQPLHLFIDRTDLADAELVTKTKVPVPLRPVFARAILYTLLSTCAYMFSGRARSGLRISSEGAFPFCQISYNQFCHRFFLSHHRSSLGVGRLRRIARFLTHSWGAFTEKIAFRSAKVIVVPSNGLARELESVYPALVRGKIRVIPNPVDIASFSRPPDFSRTNFCARLEIPRDAFVLSFCALGSFERKGLRIVLEAMTGLHDISVHLVVVGGTPGEIREFAGLAARLEVKPSVHFVGSQSDVRPYLWSSQAFVFPSAYETFCLACFQAAAAGLPLIVTAFSGIEEFIDHGVNGWSVERTSSAVQSAIREAALSPERTAAMGEAAKARVELYRQELFQARWIELLQQECAALTAAS